MKKFKFSSSVLVKVLLALVFVLCTVGAVWNVINLVNAIINLSGAVKIILYCISIILAIVLSVFSISIFFFSYYGINDKSLIVSLGFIKSKTLIEEIIAVTHFKKSNKLVVYFSDQKYTVIVIKPEDYEQFILELRAKNSKIIYNTQIDGEDTPK